MKRLALATAVFASLLLFSAGAGRADQTIEEIDPAGGADRVLPRLVSKPVAILPASLAKSGEAGSAVVTFKVDARGDVSDIEVASSSHRQLNSAAIKAVRAWRFQPGLRNGRPASFYLRAPVEFEPAEGWVEIAPVLRRRVPVLYPYEVVVAGQPAWAETRFVVDYVGRPLFAVSPSSSNRAFAKAAVAMIEASEYFPGKKGPNRAMFAATEHFQFDGELSLDPELRRVLAELRKPSPAIVPAGELAERPKVVRQISPVYPRALKDDGITGQAEIEFIVSREGRVCFPRIVSATHEDFGWAASVAVSQWQYQPPEKDGQPVEVRMTVPLLFNAQKLAEAD